MSTFTLRGPVKKERAALAARTAARFDITGKAAGTVNLEPSVFGLEPHVAVLHQVITAQLAAKRAGTQSTKTRKEVAGGGKKPFNQKGTGGARQGTIRAPHYPGGGIALGPKPRKYDQKTPKKMIRLALLSALSDRAQLGRVAVFSDFNWDAPKTKDALAALTNAGVTGKVLVVIGREDGTAFHAFRNLATIQTIDAAEVNAYDVLNNDWVVFTDATLPTAKESN
jgi:large subunit ribosomal protein L4